ncbi:hypothetical protein MPER_03842 [Moniliophthora perniciosa FA553]|nr:hypothetical protein MPER_03842 [Moniliophthora perniciosa FA553]
MGDLFAPHERASAMALYTLGPRMGPVVGPIAGGFLSTVGVKYIFIVIGSLSALASVIGIPLLRETYGPVVRARSRGEYIEKLQDVAAGPVVNP